ncbi:MAG: hypothetical protein JW884_00320 [Deltaproteobacteria bacterium]|nr:hypothetical protein [Deltaproteobacteria bacterium]
MASVYPMIRYRSDVVPLVAGGSALDGFPHRGKVAQDLLSAAERQEKQEPSSSFIDIFDIALGDSVNLSYNKAGHLAPSFRTTAGKGKIVDIFS